MRQAARNLLQRLLIASAVFAAFLFLVKSAPSLYKKAELSDPKFYYLRVPELIESGETEKALKMLRKAENRFSGNPKITADIGRHYEQLGDLKKAEIMYRFACDANPADVDSRLLLGMLYANQNQEDEAFAMFMAAFWDITNSPEFSRAKPQVIKIFRKRQRFRELMELCGYHLEDIFAEEFNTKEIASYWRNLYAMGQIFHAAQISKLEFQYPGDFDATLDITLRLNNFSKLPISTINEIALEPPAQFNKYQSLKNYTFLENFGFYNAQLTWNFQKSNAAQPSFDPLQISKSGLYYFIDDSLLESRPLYNEVRLENPHQDINGATIWSKVQVDLPSQLSLKLNGELRKISGTQKGKLTSFRSDFFRIEPGARYLLTGKLKVNQGSGFIGCAFYTHRKAPNWIATGNKNSGVITELKQVKRHDFQKYNKNEWKTFHTIVSNDPGATGGSLPDLCALEVFAASSEAEIEFKDMGMFRLQRFY